MLSHGPLDTYFKDLLILARLVLVQLFDSANVVFQITTNVLPCLNTFGQNFSSLGKKRVSISEQQLCDSEYSNPITGAAEERESYAGRVYIRNSLIAGAGHRRQAGSVANR